MGLVQNKLMDDPTIISVAIPAYNSAEYLREAIQSVLNQTFQPIEIIVVDDGSTDRTAQVCASFGSKIKYYYQQNDGSFGKGARIQAMLKCAGVWIATLDHDDRWLPTKIEKQLEVVGKNPDVGIVFTGWREIGKFGQVLSGAMPAGPAGNVYHSLLKWGTYCNSSALFRRQALIGRGLYKGAISGLDYDLWLSVARYYQVAVVDECLTEYRVYENSWSNNTLQFNAALLDTVSKQHEHLHTECSICRQVWKQRMFTSLLYHSSLEAKAGYHSQALARLRHALKIAPFQVFRPGLFLRILYALYKFAALQANGPLQAWRRILGL